MAEPLSDSERCLLETHFQVQHVAWSLGYSDPANSSRDFGRWTGKSPEAFRAFRRGREGGPAARHAGRLAGMWRWICARLGIELPIVAGGEQFPPGPVAIDRVAE